MSASAFVAGAIFGGVRYGVTKYQLFERENTVFYSVAHVKEHFHGNGNKYHVRDERYEPLPSREHEYYTYMREGWNSKVLAFRDGVLELFQGKK